MPIGLQGMLNWSNAKNLVSNKHVSSCTAAATFTAFTSTLTLTTNESMATPATTTITISLYSFFPFRNAFLFMLIYYLFPI